MEAAIEAGIHYCDLGGLYHQTLRQLKLDARAKDAGLTCVLGIGSTPGTMNVMGAYGASKLNRSTSPPPQQRRWSPAGSPGSSFPVCHPDDLRRVLDGRPDLRKERIQFVPALSGLERPSSCRRGRPWRATTRSIRNWSPCRRRSERASADGLHRRLPPAFRQTIETNRPSRLRAAMRSCGGNEGAPL